MTILIAVLGVLIVLLGVVGLAQPDRFRAMFTTMDSRTRFILAIGTRLAMAGLLWWLADDLRHPHVMRILALIALLAAIALAIMGPARLDRRFAWWLSRADGVLRVSALLAAVFGAFLVYVAA